MPAEVISRQKSRRVPIGEFRRASNEMGSIQSEGVTCPSMPELPEVETVRRSLSPWIVGEEFCDITFLFEGSLEGISAESLLRRLVGRRVQSLFRRGKYLGFSLDDASCLVVHLRMTGRLIAVDGDEPQANAHTRVVFHFRSGKALRFDDIRKFGRVMRFQDQTSLEARIRLGVEPLGSEFTPERLAALVAGRKRPIKSFLLDQSHIAGLGNIYADEALHRAAIAPWREAKSLSPGEIKSLHGAVVQVLEEGVKYKGTTLRDYVDGDGRTGRFQTRLRVYGREGQACPGCGEPVERLVLSGRSSFYCPRCQR